MLPVVLKREEPHVDQTRLIPLYKLVEEGFYPEMVAAVTHVSAASDALKRTLVRPKEYMKLREYLKRFRG